MEVYVYLEYQLVGLILVRFNSSSKFFYVINQFNNDNFYSPNETATSPLEYQNIDDGIIRLIVC